MSMAPRAEPLADSVEVAEAEIIAHLRDGRTIRVPLAWSWRLSDATPEQRATFRLIDDGYGIHWPAVDEDLSIRGMLDGISRPRVRDGFPRRNRGFAPAPPAPGRLRRVCKGLIESITATSGPRRG
jgi:hypothetical protein